MAQGGEEDTKGSLEKIKKQLNAGSGSVLFQSSLLKRSETLRKWNQRWFTLDPSTGKMEYRFQRGDATPRGLIHFDADSTITVSPLNIHGDRKYDGCCFYIGTPQKKEYFLCAETASAARAWVATLRAAALVLKAHKEAVNSLSGNGRAEIGTVAAVVAAANATAREALKDLQMPLRSSTVASAQTSQPVGTDSIDNSAVLKETLRVKDEELNQLARDLRSRDFTIKELAERLSETADAAESAASAVHSINKERQAALSEVEHLRKELQRAAEENKAAGERVLGALKARELGLQEAHRWRVELGKAREQCVIMEGAVQRGHEQVRQLKMAHEQDLVRLAQAQESRAVVLPVQPEPQEHGPTVTEGIAEKDSNDVVHTELNISPVPPLTEVELTDDISTRDQPLEDVSPPLHNVDITPQQVQEDGRKHVGPEESSDEVVSDPSVDLSQLTNGLEIGLPESLVTETVDQEHEGQ